MLKNEVNLEVVTLLEEYDKKMLLDSKAFQRKCLDELKACAELEGIHNIYLYTC